MAHQLKLPVVLFAEGGGGRPGDIDMPIVAGLNNHTFSQFAALSGKVPVVGIVHGRCFAGNAALLGCADVIIATEASNIGMSGPAMIEGGGLGSFTPEQIGPSERAVAQRRDRHPGEGRSAGGGGARSSTSRTSRGRSAHWECADQRALRHAVPENRLRVYDMRAAMQGLVDTGSLLELRAGFGAGIDHGAGPHRGPAGRPDRQQPAAPGRRHRRARPPTRRRASCSCATRTACRIVSLSDTPGFMVGPEIEAQAQVRHVCRMFMVAAHLRVPFFAVVLRKGYGLGAQAMTAGGFDAPVFTVSWPTGEFGPAPDSASRPLDRLQPAKRTKTIGVPACAPSPCSVRRFRARRRALPSTIARVARPRLATDGRSRPWTRPARASLC